MKKEAGSDAEKLNSILIDNFVNLQKAMTNLAVKFEDLSSQISKLLQLFEISARSFSEKLALNAPELEKDREFLEKLDKLLEQNKLIAKGITLMEEKVRERTYAKPPYPQQLAPRFQQQPSNYGFQQSIKKQEENP